MRFFLRTPKLYVVVALGHSSCLLRAGAKKTRLFRGHVPYQGGGRPLPA